MTSPAPTLVLSHGSHRDPTDGACIMEYASLVAGEPWSDHPACTHPVLAAAARAVNDSLPDTERHRLIPLIGPLTGTAPTGTHRDQQVLAVRLAVWSARQVLPLVAAPGRTACEAAVDTAEQWCDGTATKQKCRAAAATSSEFVIYLAAAARAATRAAGAAGTSRLAYATDSAATAATRAVTAHIFHNARDRRLPDADTLIAFLTGLVAEHTRLTGQTGHRLTDADLARLAQATRR